MKYTDDIQVVVKLSCPLLSSEDSELVTNLTQFLEECFLDVIERKGGLDRFPLENPVPKNQLPEIADSISDAFGINITPAKIVMYPVVDPIVCRQKAQILFEFTTTAEDLERYRYRVADQFLDSLKQVFPERF